MTVLRLSEQKPVAVGAKRIVYRHPEDPALLIKVMQPDATSSRGWSAVTGLDIARRYYFSMAFVRELTEHVRVRYNSGAHPHFMQRIVGFADTDLGLGLVVAAARTRDGNLAPTLKVLLDEGRVDDDAAQRLEEFFDGLTQSPVVVGDLHPGNVVYAHDEERGDHFLLIDGIGDKALIPLLRMSRTLRAQAKARKIRRMREMVDRLRGKRRPAARAEEGRRPNAVL